MCSAAATCYCRGSTDRRRPGWFRQDPQNRLVGGAIFGQETPASFVRCLLIVSAHDFFAGYVGREHFVRQEVSDRHIPRRTRVADAGRCAGSAIHTGAPLDTSQCPGAPTPWFIESSKRSRVFRLTVEQETP